MKSQLLQQLEERPILAKTYWKDIYNIDIEDLKRMYSHPSRGYHNWEHVDNVLYHIEQSTGYDDNGMVLKIAALFHDAIYDSRATDNEAKSAELVRDINLSDPLKKRIMDIILFTTYTREPETEEESIFIDADLSIFNGTQEEMVAFELGILHEYSWVPLNIYIEERCKVLEKIRDKFHVDTWFNITWLRTKVWNIGVYAGSFYPMHIGHVDILNQARKIFDRVIVVKSSDDRVQRKTKFEWKPEYGELNACLKNFETYQVKDLITDNLNDIKEMYGSATLIRGLRNGSDLQYEQNYLQTLREIDSSVQFVTFLSRPEFAHVSSSMVRELLSVDPKLAKRYYEF
jgi:pantetheine-phosphate adenylyltransferase